MNITLQLYTVYNIFIALTKNANFCFVSINMYKYVSNQTLSLIKQNSIIKVKSNKI